VLVETLRPISRSAERFEGGCFDFDYLNGR
jgi:hypothetical protein